MVGFVFPGQGSQHVGMGQFLVNEFKAATEVFEEASDAISLDMKKLCFDSSESDLAMTENTQPALFVVSAALNRVLTEVIGLKPSIGAGHSVGEFGVLYSAGVLSLRDAVQAVRTRGKAMQEATPLGVGGMLAVMGLEMKAVQKLCHWAVEGRPQWVLSPANENSPGQIVISGHLEAIDFVQTQFKAEEVLGETKRVKFIPLKVSAPFHCALMKPAELKMQEVLSQLEFNVPRFPVVQNIDAESSLDPEVVRTKLIAQICGPVRWVECVDTLKKQGASKLVEVGSGKVLSGLIKKIDSDQIQTFNVNHLDDLRQIEKVML